MNPSFWLGCWKFSPETAIGLDSLTSSQGLESLDEGHQPPLSSPEVAKIFGFENSIFWWKKSKYRRCLYTYISFYFVQCLVNIRSSLSVFHLLSPCNFLRIIKEKCIRSYNANVPAQQLYRAFSLPFPASEEETDSMLSVIALLSIPKGVLQTGQKTVNYTELYWITYFKILVLPMILSFQCEQYVNTFFFHFT